MATRRNRAVTRCPLALCSVYAANTSSSASGKRHLPPGWSERRDLFAWVAALRILISPAAHFDTRLLFTPNRLATACNGEVHWPGSFLCCSRRNSSTTSSLNAKVRATRRSPSRRPLRFGMPSLRSFAARIRESQRKTVLVLSRGQVPTVSLTATRLLSCHLSQARWQLIRTTKHAWRKAEQRQSQTTVKLPVVSMLLRFAAYFMVWV